MPDPLLVICPVSEPMKDRLAPYFDLYYLNDIRDIGAWGQEHSNARQILTDGHFGVTPDVMTALPNLSMISCYGVGYDNIDTAVCTARGIVATHTPDVLNAEVATSAIMLLMACYRELLRDQHWAKTGLWAEHGVAPLTRSLDNRPIGILGMGRIGQEIARKLAPWSPEILYHTRTPKNVPFEHLPDLVEMARRVEALIVITPGGAGTQHLVNQNVIEALGPEGTLINVARGSVVDEGAMIDALIDGRLGWAGLDVFENEPHIPERLRKLKNVVLTPHIGSATVECRAAMGNLAIDNLLLFQRDGAVKTPVPECQ